jgi:GTPase SAR1 family protein
LEENPLKSFSKEITKQGTKGVMGFLQEAKNGTIEWKDVKVMFVGEEGVGKTSLLTCFKNSTNKLKKGARNLSTNGIEMSEWKANKGLKIQCYDMGGQMVFYPTHEFFMSGRSIYLVVFSILKFIYRISAY